MAKLTDAAIRAAKPHPEGKSKLYDGTHLYLRVQKRTKSWCWRYRLRGKDNIVTWESTPHSRSRRLVIKMPSCRRWWRRASTLPSGDRPSGARRQGRRRSRM